MIWSAKQCWKHISGKYMCWSQFLITFITKKLQHRCFPVKFVKFLRILILKNICDWLLLCIHYNSHDYFKFHPFTNIRDSHSQMFYKIGVLKNVEDFRWKSPVLESFFNKVVDLRPAPLIKGDSNTRVFQWNLQNFENTFSYRILPVAASIPL